MRRCLLPPPVALIDVAWQLSNAVDAHLDGDTRRAHDLFASTNRDDIRDWVELLWGKEKPEFHQFRDVEGSPASLPLDQRAKPRMPNKALERALIERDGYKCRYCGAPLIRKEVRRAIHAIYPKAVPWGRTNATQHAAFQAMWLQFEHLTPHSRGGETSFDNMIISCAPCNFAKAERTLDEMDLADPRNYPIKKTNWDGLERMLT